MTEEKLNEVLKLHELWLQGNPEGQRADLRNADLSKANLSYANLSYANLGKANLGKANLRNADLRNADLSDANLRNADFRNADFRNADLDFSCWPLWCGSLGAVIDERIARQLLYHLLDVWPAYRIPELVEEANKFHRIPAVPALTMPERGE